MDAMAEEKGRGGGGGGLVAIDAPYSHLKMMSETDPGGRKKREMTFPTFVDLEFLEGVGDTLGPCIALLVGVAVDVAFGPVCHDLAEEEEEGEEVCQAAGL